MFVCAITYFSVTAPVVPPRLKRRQSTIAFADNKVNRQSGISLCEILTEVTMAFIARMCFVTINETLNLFFGA